MKNQSIKTKIKWSKSVGIITKQIQSDLKHSYLAEISYMCPKNKIFFKPQGQKSYTIFTNHMVGGKFFIILRIYGYIGDKSNEKYLKF